MTAQGIPRSRAKSSPFAEVRLVTTTCTVASRAPCSICCRIDRRLVPAPEMSTPIGTGATRRRVVSDPCTTLAGWDAAVIVLLQHQLIEVELYGHGIVAGEAGVAEVLARNADGVDHAVEAEIPERVRADVLANALDVHAGGDQLATARRVDPQVARVHHWRGRDAH